jgi:cytochrome c5
MKNQLTAKERAWLSEVKQLPCSVCDAPPPSDAHHIKQGKQYTCVALCKDCHQGSILGWHGQKKAWAIRKMDELDALNVTINRLAESLFRIRP